LKGITVGGAETAQADMGVVLAACSLKAPGGRMSGLPFA
jgi:hypothetical protein